MKNCLRALLLVTIGVMLLSPIAMAQDALSAILPSPYTSRVGSQLIYFYEDGANLGARGSFQSFLTVTNTNITNGVIVHFQFYQVFVSSGSTTSCQELFDFVDYLTAGQRYIFDPKAIRRPSNFGGGAIVGTATDGRYIMTITPIVSFLANDLRARSFNWLSGQIWVSDIGKSATYMTNAVSRMGVNRFGTPLNDGDFIFGPSSAANPAGTPGFDNYLQMFRPQVLAVNSFFRTSGAGAVQPGVPFGNRLTVMSWVDQYFGVDPFFRITPASADLAAFVFDDQENAFSVPTRRVTCLQEWVIAPDVAGAAGNFPDFIGPALSSAVAASGGWLRIRVAFVTGGLQSILGWFSQYLGTFGGGDYLIGIGRQGLSISGALPILVSAASSDGSVITTTSTTAP